MDAAAKINYLEDELAKLHMKIDAICETLKIGLDYKPHSYEVYNTGEEQ